MTFFPQTDSLISMRSWLLKQTVLRLYFQLAFQPLLFFEMPLPAKLDKLCATKGKKTKDTGILAAPLSSISWKFTPGGKHTPQIGQHVLPVKKTACPKDTRNQTKLPFWQIAMDPFTIFFMAKARQICSAVAWLALIAALSR